MPGSPGCTGQGTTALAGSAEPGAAGPGATVALVVENTGSSCVSGGVCATLEAPSAGGGWVPADDGERACPAVAVTLAPGAVQRFGVQIPAGTPPGPYRLSHLLSGPQDAVRVTAPVEVLP